MIGAIVEIVKMLEEKIFILKNVIYVDSFAHSIMPTYNENPIHLSATYR